MQIRNLSTTIIVSRTTCTWNGCHKSRVLAKWGTIVAKIIDLAVRSDPSHTPLPCSPPPPCSLIILSLFCFSFFALFYSHWSHPSSQSHTLLCSLLLHYYLVHLYCVRNMGFSLQVSTDLKQLFFELLYPSWLVQVNDLFTQTILILQVYSQTSEMKRQHIIDTEYFVSWILLCSFWLISFKLHFFTFFLSIFILFKLTISSF